MNQRVLNNCLKAQCLLQSQTPGGRVFHSHKTVITIQLSAQE